MSSTFEVLINGRPVGQYSTLDATFPVIEHAFLLCDYEYALTWAILQVPRSHPHACNLAVHTMTRDIWRKRANSLQSFVLWMNEFGWNDYLDDMDDDE